MKYVFKLFYISIQPVHIEQIIITDFKSTSAQSFQKNNK